MKQLSEAIKYVSGKSYQSPMCFESRETMLQMSCDQQSRSNMLKAADPMVVKQAGGVARVMEEVDLRGWVGV